MTNRAWDMGQKGHPPQTSNLKPQTSNLKRIPQVNIHPASPMPDRQKEAQRHKAPVGSLI